MSGDTFSEALKRAANVRRGRTYQSLRRLLPEPPRSEINPLAWDLSPADMHEFYLTRISDEEWDHIYLNSSEYKRSQPLLVQEWDREIFGDGE